MAVPTLAFLAGSPPAAIELASVPWIRAQRHPQSDWPTGRPHLSTRPNRGPLSSSERADRSAPTSASQNPRRNPHSARGTVGAPTPRDFVPWRFSDAGLSSAWIVLCLPASENLHMSRSRMGLANPVNLAWRTARRQRYACRRATICSVKLRDSSSTAMMVPDLRVTAKSIPAK